MRLRPAWLAAIALAACGAAPRPAHPAFWRVDGPGGGHAWLLGTIHALDAPAKWRSPAIDRGLANADRVLVEVAEVRDEAAMARTFLRLAATPGQPQLAQRIAAPQRAALARLMRQGGYDESSFASVETWAAALMLARGGDAALDSAYGVDKAVLDAAGSKPVAELEGTEMQLRTFDTMPERQQRALLAAVVREGGKGAGGESLALARAWRSGDMRTIEAETHRGVLADPDLRMALFTRRNRAWSERIAAMLAAGGRPFVAVGAAHMAGAGGLPALLAARGYTVTRLQ